MMSRSSSEFDKAAGDEWLWGSGNQPRAVHMSLPSCPLSVKRQMGKPGRQTLLASVSGRRSW